MRAMVIETFGGPEVFSEQEIDRPQPGPRELLVRVVASGTNPVEAKLRADGSARGVILPAVLGADASGVVEETGPGCRDFSAGDELYYTPELASPHPGTYAEYHVVDEAIVALKPQGLSHVEAAAVPLAGRTAWQVLIDRLQLAPAETVLIHGGAGGVGSFAVQIAKAAGARVLATASAENQDLLKELGTDLAIDYGSDDPTEIALEVTNGNGVDAVLDTVGGDIVERSLRATRTFGRLGTILGPKGDLTALYQRNQTLHGVMMTRNRPQLVHLDQLIERGQLRPVIDQVLPLEQVGDAHARLDSGHGRGKIVLSVAEDKGRSPA
ncbi:MAG: zinc-dependent alcohol dehydrogenase family protein [Actinomycetota bacterium]